MRKSSLAIMLLLCGSVSEGLAAEPLPFKSLAEEYSTSTKQVLTKYCTDCHSTADKEGELDLQRFTTFSAVRKDPRAWQKVAAMLASGEMPPADSDQPSKEQFDQLRSWVRRYLDAESRAHAGDPGPIVLRRLNNAEYTYTIRDLTGVAALNPTREFPVDGGAGEGFTNTGAAQGMSPALVQKYLDAAKQVANHVVLQPDGIRFSPSTTRRDHTDELLAQIRRFYAQYTTTGGGSAVNLQGIRFETNQGGRLPVEKYLAATIEERAALAGEEKSFEAVASARALNARYLRTLWEILARKPDDHPSVLIDALRTKWRNASPENVHQLAAEIEQAQAALWKFNSVGHIGMTNGPKRWMDTRSLVTTSQDVRFRLPDASGDVVLYLTADELPAGDDHEVVVWQRPRIEFKADKKAAVRPPILLRDVRSLAAHVEQTMASEIGRTSQYLATLQVLQQAGNSPTDADKELEKAARERQLDLALLKNWAALVGLQRQNPREIAGRLANKLTRVHDHEEINGWGGPDTSLLTNRSERAISFLTLTVPPRAVTVHPSPTLDARVTWRSPQDVAVRIGGLVADADNKCGNGATWRVELLTASESTVLAGGVIDNGKNQRFQPDRNVAVKAGDLVSLVVNARHGSHVCDTTHVELKLSEVGGEQHVWDLASDIVDHVLKGNPLPDAYGNQNVWHFCAAAPPKETKSILPGGSLLFDWRAAVIGAKPAAEISKLATAVERLLASEPDSATREADKSLRQRLLDWNGPLHWLSAGAQMKPSQESSYGVATDLFGKGPDGAALDPADLCVQTPQMLEVRLPRSLVAGGEFVATCRLAARDGKAETSGVQIHVRTERSKSPAISVSTPILVRAGTAAQQRMEAATREFRELFPPALCYTRIVPVDEVVTLQLFYREDEHLQRLMLDQRQTDELNRLWAELFFVSQEPIALAGAYEQLVEFATQDNPAGVKALKPLKKPIHDRADQFRERLKATEPVQVNAVLEFADRAWRRPLTNAERHELQGLYQRLRENEISHAEAIRLTIARVLTSPAFLYKLEQPKPGTAATPVSDLELATRLSYFLWSSLPDEELRSVAAAGRLTTGGENGSSQLLEQTRRMLASPQTRRLAVEFACQWLHVRDFDKNDDKNEKLYPEFAGLRRDMYEETVRFFEDMFRHDGSVLSMLDADHTFLSEALARHYGIGGVQTEGWQRVDHVRGKGRGGVLAMATVLASQSGASRTSPILRGNWVYETLLGERLPRPPANVPQLPETVPSGLTERQLIEQHSSVAACAKCHARIDPFGFSLEQYDAIGRLRPQKADTKTTLADGKTIEGIDGLRTYLLTDRRDDFLRQFCRKLLGYALGREVQLSDELLLAEMQARLKANDYRFRVAVEAIVTSPQFRNIRGLSFDP